MGDLFARGRARAGAGASGSGWGPATERQDWGSGFATTDLPSFLGINPNGRVSVVCDGVRVPRESNTICRYVAAVQAREDRRLAEPWARAQVVRWMDWQGTELIGAWRYGSMALARRDPGFAEPGQVAATGGFVVGARPTLADVVLALSVNRWLMRPMEIRPVPKHCANGIAGEGAGGVA